MTEPERILFDKSVVSVSIEGQLLEECDMKLIRICWTVFLMSEFEVDVFERSCKWRSIVTFQKSVVLYSSSMNWVLRGSKSKQHSHKCAAVVALSYKNDKQHYSYTCQCLHEGLRAATRLIVSRSEAICKIFA